jgi:hypothetical protein
MGKNVNREKVRPLWLAKQFFYHRTCRVFGLWGRLPALREMRAFLEE